MKNTISSVKEVPARQEELRRPARLRDYADNDRWENEGGAVSIGSEEPIETSQSVSKLDAKTEYAVLISGLLIGFGVVTLVMTIGAAREEAEMAGAMTAYGSLSVALGLAVAGTFWLWRIFWACRPEVTTSPKGRTPSLTA